MFSKQKAKYVVAFVVGSLSWASVSAYIAPNPTAERAQVDNRPDVVIESLLKPWSEDLSKDAVDSAGIERDLDGNASALVASQPR